MEVHTEMVNMLGKVAPSKIMLCEWDNGFKNGRTSIEENPLERPPKTASTPEIVTKIKDIVLEHCRLSRSSKHFIRHSEQYFKWSFEFQKAVCRG